MQHVQHRAEQKSDTSLPPIWCFFRIADLPKHVTHTYTGDNTIPKKPTNAAILQSPPNMHSSFERVSMFCPKTIQGQQNAIQQVPHPPGQDSTRNHQSISAGTERQRNDKTEHSLAWFGAAVTHPRPPLSSGHVWMKKTIFGLRSSFFF